MKWTMKIAVAARSIMSLRRSFSSFNGVVHWSLLLFFDQHCFSRWTLLFDREMFLRWLDLQIFSNGHCSRQFFFVRRGLAIDLNGLVQLFGEMFDLFVQMKVLVEWSRRSDCWFDVDEIPSLTRSDHRWLLSSIVLAIESIRSATHPTLDDRPFVSLRSTLSARRSSSEDLRVVVSSRPRPSAVFLAVNNVIRSLEKKFFLTEKETCVFSSLCFTSTFVVFRLLERLVVVGKIFLLIFRLLQLASRSTGREDRRLVRCELAIAFSSTTRCSSCPSVNSPIDRRRHDTSSPIHRIVSRIENDSFLLSLERCFFLSLVRRGSSYTRVSRASLDHPEKFWSEEGEKISCFQRWKKVFDKTNLLRPRWFQDGLLNVTCNCLDPHLGKHGAIKQRLFTIRRWPDKCHSVDLSRSSQGSETVSGYSLKEKYHVQQGDVVFSYMPMIRQAIVSERLIILSWEDSVPMD